MSLSECSRQQRRHLSCSLTPNIGCPSLLFTHSKYWLPILVVLVAIFLAWPRLCPGIDLVLVFFRRSIDVLFVAEQDHLDTRVCWLHFLTCLRFKKKICRSWCRETWRTYRTSSSTGTPKNSSDGFYAKLELIELLDCQASKCQSSQVLFSQPYIHVP
jgi:hypothetical protein